MNSRSPVRIPAPRKPEPPAPYSFPIIASVAPVVVAVGMWWVTQSPFALMFAALGPVVAVASLADARIQGKKKSRRELARFTTELELARRELAAAHETERAERDEASPAGQVIAALHSSDPGRWSNDGAELFVALGSGVTSSAVSIEVEHSRSPDEADDVLAVLAHEATQLKSSPVVVDARLGIGLRGAPSQVCAVARSIVVQLARALSPAEFWWAASEAASTDGHWEWLNALPHGRGIPLTIGPSAIAFGAIGNDFPVVTLVLARDATELTGSQRVVVSLGAGSNAVVAHPDRSARVGFDPHFVSLELAHSWAETTRADAIRHGLVPDSRSIPHSTALSPVLGLGGSGLTCFPVTGAQGPIPVDLVADGPHAIVGGATGSGKSEFLISWVLAMAAAHSPAEVNFLLVDFKGGSAFTPIEALPHVVGMLTDLDSSTAERALESLRAELKHRERELAAAGARSVESSALPRLVVVVDEFAAMASEFPELHALFTDIASRGRSLGVHLILCTQRPAAAARDGVLANADLRVSLRVNNRADSVAIVGTDAAATLPQAATGRAAILVGGELSIAQVALADDTDVCAVTERWPGPWRPRRPWCEPLAADIPITSLPPGAIGLLDLPNEQRQEPAHYDPARHGHVLVLGAARSGKSTALAALAHAAPGNSMWVPHDVEGGWDVIADPEALTGRLIVLDDLDSLLTRFGDEHRAALVDRLAGLLRDGPASDIHLAIGAQRITGEVQQLVGLVGSRLLLSQPSKQEHVLAGGDAARFRASSRPGLGDWFGTDLQVADAPLPEQSKPRPTPALSGDRPVAVVTPRPAAMAARLRGSYSVVELAGNPADPRELTISTGGRTAIVGDPDEWQSRWGALGAARNTADVVFDGCGLAEFRALTRSRELPPPIAPGSDASWLLTENGTVTRVLLP